MSHIVWSHTFLWLGKCKQQQWGNLRRPRTTVCGWSSQLRVPTCKRGAPPSGAVGGLQAGPSVKLTVRQQDHHWPPLRPAWFLGPGCTDERTPHVLTAWGPFKRSHLEPQGRAGARVPAVLSPRRSPEGLPWTLPGSPPKQAESTFDSSAHALHRPGCSLDLNSKVRAAEVVLRRCPEALTLPWKRIHLPFNKASFTNYTSCPHSSLHQQAG